MAALEGAPRRKVLPLFAGINLDTRLPQTTQPYFLVDRVGTEDILHFDAIPSKMRLIHKAEPPSDFRFSLPSSFPDGGHQIALTQTEAGGIVDYALTIYPELSTGVSAEILSVMLAGIDPKDHAQELRNFFGPVFAHLSSVEGLTLVAHQKKILEVKTDGSWKINSDYEQNNGDVWEGVLKYKYTAGAIPSFECSLAKVIVNERFTDSFEGNSVYEYTMPEEFYLIVGLLFQSEDARDLLEYVDPLLRNSVMTDSAIRDIIMPYMYLTPVIDSEAMRTT